MNQQEMIESLRAEIAKIQRVLDLLLEQPAKAEEPRRRGRLKGSSKRAAGIREAAPRKRTSSGKGKAGVTAVQKKRSAAQKAIFPNRVARKGAASAKAKSKSPLPKLAKKSAAAPAKKVPNKR